MKRLFDKTDAYYISIFSKILTLAPVIGLSAAGVLTGARLMGFFAFVEVPHIIFFDIACCSYVFFAWLLGKKGIVVNGKVDDKVLTRKLIVVDLVVIFQWNLISYIFPTRDFWGFAPMFVLLTSFMFRADIVLIEIIGMTASIALSWFINGDALLPAPGDAYMENLILRIVALVISFTVIYVLTLFAENFTKLAKENFQSLSKQNESLEEMGRGIIDFTADIIEERDTTSGSHVKRLKGYTKVLAEQVAEDCPEYGLDEDKIELITLACVLHDIGKIAIPDSILLKPAKLTAEEFEVIKTHTTLGAEMVEKLPATLGEEYIRCCREICQFHHEKYDGKGYPVGLKGDEIPISAQIVSMVDCYDALTSVRPYKNALPSEMAIQMILNGECGAFSEKMKECLNKCKNKL